MCEQCSYKSIICIHKNNNIKNRNTSLPVKQELGEVNIALKIDLTAFYIINMAEIIIN